jgi:hypothetical protein
MILIKYLSFLDWLMVMHRSFLSIFCILLEMNLKVHLHDLILVFSIYRVGR